MVTNTLFRTQWMECSYHISGSYGPAPRYMFYILAMFGVLYRKSAWIGTAALSSVTAYSATAAVLAIVLFAFRTKMIPTNMRDYRVFLVEGLSNLGRDDSLGSVAWLPVRPMACNNDGDPVLAIAATAFPILLPMQTWSTTFKKSYAKSVLFSWSGLLFIGTVCALINAAFADL